MSNNGQAPPIELPYSMDAEQAVLSCILLSESIDELCTDAALTSEDFYIESNRALYALLQKRSAEGKKLDYVSIAALMRTQEQRDYLRNLMINAVTAHAAAHYAKIVKDMSLRRRYIANCQQLMAAAADTQLNIEDLQSAASKAVWTDAAPEQMRSGAAVVVDAYQEIIEASKRGGSLPGVPSGWRDFDALTGGFCSGDLVIIAARPSMGKTMLATNIAEFAALKANKTVAFFSLEMTAASIIQRIMASDCGIEYKKIRYGRLEAEEYAKLGDFVKNQRLANLHICAETVSVASIRAHCRQLKRRNKRLDLVIIDYLQIIAAADTKHTRNDEVAVMSRELKQLAKELDCPVIALSQLSRANEKRNDKRPLLSDLRDSGAIEQDGDLIVLLHRQDYYVRETQDNSMKDMLECIVAKARNGATGTAYLNYNPRLQHISNVKWDVRDKDKPEKEGQELDG